MASSTPTIEEDKHTRMKIAIIGTGYVGLTTAVVLAYLNPRVARSRQDEGSGPPDTKGKALLHEPAFEPT